MTPMDLFFLYRHVMVFHPFFRLLLVPHFTIQLSCSFTFFSFADFRLKFNGFQAFTSL
jgi:hypothetical protein